MHVTCCTHMQHVALSFQMHAARFPQHCQWCEAPAGPQASLGVVRTTDLTRVQSQVRR